ncbi:MAG: transposase [Gemmatimonas sp.]
MFAIDGVKLPSNASKQRSGTREDFERQATKLEAVVTTMLQRHRDTESAATEPSLDTKAVARVERLQRERFGAVEPVFANVCYNKGLARLTLRSRGKVNAQRKLFCLVHNIEKLAHSGYGQ